MLKTNASVEQIVNEVAEKLKEEITVHKLILFGSYNNGIPREDSDFDIAVISDDFENMGLMEKMELFARVTVAVDSRVELMGFSVREFEQPEKSSLLAVIKREGNYLFNR